MAIPPSAKINPRELTVHGDVRVDNYFWLRDREDPVVIQYLEAENRYTEEMMAHTQSLQEELYREILGRIQEDDISVPVKRDDYFYYARTEEGKAYAIQCRKHRGLDAPEEILLDANALAEGQSYFRLGNFAVSPDHRLLAYSVDFEGDEAYIIHVKNLQTGELLLDRIENTYYSLEWANDNRTFFYTVLDEAKRPYRALRHELGEPADTLVYQEQDARFTLGLGKTRSRRFVFIDLSSALTSEVLYLEADEPRSEFRVMLPRRQGVEYDASHHGEYFFIRTNDQAKNFRLMRTPVANPSSADWQEVIPARAGVTIEGVDSFENHLVVYERERGLEKIAIHDSGGALDHYIEFPEPVYSVGATGNAEYRTNILRFNYTSLVTPASVFDYEVGTRERELKKQYQVRGGYDASRYQSERIFAKAPDGVEVPISLVYRKGFVRDGSAALLLYGYGAYGHSIDPRFSSDRLSLLDRGFVFAIAHIRGGADLGEEWHDQGKLLQKKNTFTDFIACAEHLTAERYTASEHLAIMGGSAGGLLIGAVLNMRPDLFHAAIAKVPFVDTLNTMLDPTLPLTIAEYEEWGNPEQEEFYRYIRSYSPYDNVAPREYPAMLVTGGLNDPRVSYWEPAKWVAKLRARKTDSNVLLLKTDMGSGHFGPSGRYEGIKEVAFDYAFLLSRIVTKDLERSSSIVSPEEAASSGVNAPQLTPRSRKLSSP
ncbi:MAG TPA: S9 family peptidase [Bryobacteraceae bacterium]|nr:S9 family peptidase [Bryobacteraceae bacterium]